MPIPLKRSSSTFVSLIDYQYPNFSEVLDDTNRLSFGFAKGSRYSASSKLPSQKTVMVCDDEYDVLRAYKIALASRYSVLTASSGQECLRKYLNEVNAGSKVDALLLDYKLGDMLGDEVACKIRDLDGTKVILISAYEMSSAFLENLKQRNCIVSFVKKPVTMSTLLASVERILLE